MGQIGTLVTGAGVITVISGQSQLDQFLVIGDVDTAVPLTGLTIEVDGKPFLQIQGSQALMQAFAQWQMEKAGANVGYMLKVATGQIRKNTTFRLTNAGATTPAIYNFSELSNGVPLEVATQTVNASSYQNVDKFSALFIATPANVSNLEVEFTDGTSQTLTMVETAAYFALTNQADTDGQLSAVVVVDNTQGNISNVKINTNAGGSCLTLTVKIPDEAFERFKQLLK